MLDLGTTGVGFGWCELGAESQKNGGFVSGAEMRVAVRWRGHQRSGGRREGPPAEKILDVDGYRVVGSVRKE